METRLKRLRLAIETTKNWPAALLVWLGIAGQCKAKFRNGSVLSFNKNSWNEYLRHVYLFHHFPTAQISNTNIVFPYKNRQLSFNFGRYGFDTVLEIFGGDPYREFFDMTSVKGKAVVDIGAAFGDTAISFLMEGAERVYAIEAFPGYHQLAAENIMRNGFSSQCELTLAAVAGTPGSLIISQSLEDMFGTGIEKSESGAEVPMMTMAQIVNQYDVRDAILKLDVEGYEYEILLNTEGEVLRRFSDMVIEYHYGYEKLEEHLLKAGFKVVHTEPHLVYMPQLKDENARRMHVGNIYASRMDSVAG